MCNLNSCLKALFVVKKNALSGDEKHLFCPQRGRPFLPLGTPTVPGKRLWPREEAKWKVTSFHRYQWIGLRENLQETIGISRQICCFPVILPLNQSIEGKIIMFTLW